MMIVSALQISFSLQYLFACPNHLHLSLHAHELSSFCLFESVRHHSKLLGRFDYLFDHLLARQTSCRYLNRYHSSLTSFWSFLTFIFYPSTIFLTFLPMLLYTMLRHIQKIDNNPVTTHTKINLKAINSSII